LVEVGRCKMKSLLIDGGCVLNGQIKVQGSKNAALPIIAASLLFPGKTVLQECPQIRDVELMKNLLECLGCEVSSRENCLSVEAGEAKVNNLPARWVGGMRSSILLLGAMLARFHSAVICYPGGCVIGERPIDLHIMALEKLGAEIHIEGECIIAKATNLKGCKIQFPISSVGATEQAILAACGAQGITDLYNAATEPEVVHLCRFLHSAGIEIQGIGCKHLRITGQSFAKNYPGEIQYTIPADRIVAGTYLLMAAACGGEIYLENGQSQEMEALLAVTRQLGSRVEGSKTDLPGGIFLKAEKNLKAPEKIVTGPYPEFPTDMQPILTATLSKADGESIIEETVFENRFCYVSELEKMGGKFRTDNRRLSVYPAYLHGACVQAADLRGGAALVLAGLIAEGRTKVENAHFIERGYEDIVRDLRKLGAKITSET